MSDEKKQKVAEKVAEVGETEETPKADGKACPLGKLKGKRWPVVAAVVAVVAVIAGSGFYVWHEQPSFCAAICHTPMDQYLVTYEQEPGVEGVDKWGNTVEDTSSMLCVTHGAAGLTCMSCHVPTLGEQMSEGANWATGNYEAPLTEKSLTDLVRARGLKNSDEFCLNESCHNMTRADLVAATDKMEFNPHVSMHGEAECSDCHKGHRASVMTCTECHDEAKAPEGWLTYQQSEWLK